MKKSSVIAIAAGFAAFILVVAISITAIMLHTPIEASALLPGNYLGNIMNGANVLEDDGFLFFSQPGTPGIYRTETKNPEQVVKISNEGDGFLQCYNSTYYYMADNTLKSMKFDGSNVETVLEHVIDPLIVGSNVYYINRSNEICKYSIKYKSKTTLVSGNVHSLSGRFNVYSGNIYYLSDHGDIRFVSARDGEGDSLFIGANATMFEIDGKYTYYISEGIVKSAQMTTESIYSNDITAADSFVVNGEYMIYNCGGKLYAGSLNELVNNEEYKPVQLLDGNGSGLSVDGTYFYYFDEAGNFYRCDKTGENIITINSVK